MQFNTAQRELTLKIVYYGPGLSGKTTNLRALYQRIQPTLRDPHLMTLDTADDRTLFFDMLPIIFRAGNLKVRLRLFTVPGQVMHNSTRRIVLQGTDAIAFIADSQPAKRQENYKYWMNMVENLRTNGLSVESLPHVVQWNKKDLGDASTAQAIENMRREARQPVFEAIAVQGIGVVETFLALVEATYARIDKVYLLGEKLGLTRQGFVEEVRRCFIDPPPSTYSSSPGAAITTPARLAPAAAARTSAPGAMPAAPGAKTSQPGVPVPPPHNGEGS